MEKNLPNKLDADSFIHLSPSWPVVLVESILNGHHWILLNESLVHVKHLVRRQLQAHQIRSDHITNTHVTQVQTIRKHLINVTY